MTSVCLVTINFNSHKETHDCLESLSRLHTKDIQLTIVVVDNGSKEKFILTPSEKKRGIQLIETGENLGFTGGSNVGIRYALARTADYVMLLNNDTIVDPSLLEELLKGFHHAKAGMVVPKIYFAKGHEYHADWYQKKDLGRVLWYAGGYVDWANVFNKHTGMDEVDKGQYDKAVSVAFASGCCMLIKREVLEKVGLFDDKYYLYFEDGDLSQRLIRSGYQIIYQPSALLWHITSASAGGSGSPLHDYYLTRNRLLYGMRYAPLRTKFALFRESIGMLLRGRTWQKKGVQDFYAGILGKGSYHI